MMSRQQSRFQAEMEIVKRTRKLSPEERRRELRREMFRELRELEIERRARVALEELQRSKREKEESKKEAERLKKEWRRLEAKQRKEEKRRAEEQMALEKQKQEQLQKEKLQWKRVMMVEEVPIIAPTFTQNDLKREQQRRHDEAEQREAVTVDIKCLDSEVKSWEQNKQKILINNWVEDELHSIDSARCPSVFKFLKTQKSPKPLQWVRKRVRFGHGSEKKQADMEKRMVICRLKERYQNLETKDRRWDHLANQSDGYHMSRNSILKKSIF
ncbi:trichohyalin-like [Lates japonicus]|uniref:Trichohyalin-like protein n=1 Tax=Lates japonicus TaxID=270547 RepID=A0AAD3N1P5_LATJO|nr:trichohyalin-like protein [Lates japonicus]